MIAPDQSTPFLVGFLHRSKPSQTLKNRKMKIAATLVVFFAATASAFGLHNGVTSAVKTITKAGFSKPMVQAVDINGNRLNAGVRKYNDTATFFLKDMTSLSKLIR